MTPEHARLAADNAKSAPWKKWGPYLAERQWGTVREDYSANGDAWNYFTHDQARSRAYRWGEDGLAGISDDHQLLCFALALWNGKDPILKERLFGLANSEGNHGEDVKEYYFYLDSTPTHSYMKFLYKYPHNPFPYADLVQKNRERSRTDPEFELLDTGIFTENRYFDIFVEYAKASPEELLIQITLHNRGPESAPIHLLPTLWFRNTWSWAKPTERPALRQVQSPHAVMTIEATHPGLGTRSLYIDNPAELLFTENETNTEAIAGTPNTNPYTKDAFHNYITHGQRNAINPHNTGTNAAAHFTLTIAPGQSQTLRLRLCDGPARPDVSQQQLFGPDFESTLTARRNESDQFYATVIPPHLDPDAALIMRQALAGMLWSKQFYFYDVDQWLTERGADPFNPAHHAPRNDHWHHMYNADIISMPDKWEYPWYAAWDLAFHVLALTLVDPVFGKQQLDLMLQSHYQHPNGQLPAYEWNFGDVNPPVHAWATIFTYNLDKIRSGAGDIPWLENSFQKLLMNFTWWVNRKDRAGSNVFEGGFLGLDNIGVFDRSSPLPGGGYLDQADGTAWMALFCQNMLQIASELALHDPRYFSMVQKFFEHFLWIASSMLHSGPGTGMWDEEDGFFYDVLRLPDGSAHRLKVRSMVGLLPLCAVTVYEVKLLPEGSDIEAHLLRFLSSRPELTSFIHNIAQPGAGSRHMASVLNEHNLRRVLERMLDENEFLSPFGIRSLSRCHADQPYVFHFDNQEFRVPYLPGDSDSGMFGGNSNWRGPIWMPVNGLIIRALLNYFLYYGDDFKVECPTRSGKKCNLYQVAEELSRRLSNIFLRNPAGKRPVYADAATFQNDPHWKDLLLFYEFFHGDTGAGLGASHQTGWTGVIARLMHLFATTTSQQALELGKLAAIIDTLPDPPQSPHPNPNLPRAHQRKKPKPPPNGKPPRSSHPTIQLHRRAQMAGTLPTKNS